MEREKVTKMVIYDDLCSVLEEAGCKHLLEIMFDANPEVVGINYIGLSVDTIGMVSFIPNVKTNGEFVDIPYTLYNKKLERNERESWQNGIRIVESFSAKQERKKSGIKTRVGRLLGRFVDVNLYNKELGRINSILAADNYEIEVVQGEDIRKFYHHESYYPKSGTLNGSCMRGDHCQDFFNVYTKNPDLVKMAVLRKKGDLKTKIRGRALLWQDVVLHKNIRKWCSDKEEVIATNNYYFNEGIDKTSIKYMDRIYCCSSLSNIFVDWATNNGYHYRGCTFDGNLISAPASCDGSPGFNTNYHMMEVEVQTEETLYPYLDTFASGYYNSDGEYVLCSDEADRGSSQQRDLQRTNGCVDDEVCVCCGEGINTDYDDYYVDNHGDYYCQCCGDDELKYVETEDSYYRYDEVDYCDDCSTYFVSSEGCNVYDSMNNEARVCAHCADENYVFVERNGCGDYYHIDLVTCCEKCDEPILIDDVVLDEDDNRICASCYTERGEVTGLAS